MNKKKMGLISGGTAAIVLAALVSGLLFSVPAHASTLGGPSLQAVPFSGKTTVCKVGVAKPVGTVKPGAVTASQTTQGSTASVKVVCK